MTYKRSEKRNAKELVLGLLAEAKSNGELTVLQKCRVGVKVRFSGTLALEILESLVPECCELKGVSDLWGEAGEGETGVYKLNLDIDIDKLRELLNLLLEYIPLFVDLIKTLFV